MGQLERIRIFEGSRDLCNAHPVLKKAIEDSIRNQVLYWEEDALPPYSGGASYAQKLYLSKSRSYQAARPYARMGKKVCVLNFASSVSPGGGVVNGASAQEESLCRISSLYFALKDENTAGRFYKQHWDRIHLGKMNRANTDDMIYTPGVVVFREDDDECAFLPEDEWYSVDVLTCAAPDLRDADDASAYRPTADELTNLIKNRIRKIIHVAALHGVQTLILGAFGCGVFLNPPSLVANVFYETLKDYAGAFEDAEFAVYSSFPGSPNYLAFSEIPGIITLS